MRHLELLFADETLARNVVASVLLLLVVLIVRAGAMRFVRRHEASTDAVRLRWAAGIRNLTLLAVGLGLATIWAQEIQGFALSVAAVAVALVIATKELILCISGSVLRATSGAFAIGDRVEVKGVRGDVIDRTLFTTTVLEIGPSHQRTGRAVVLPNSLFLTDAVVNESFTDNYVLHVVAVPLAADANLEAQEVALLAAAREVCAGFLGPARRNLGARARAHGLTPFSVDPRVTIQLPEPGKITLLLRVPTPSRERGRTEQLILRRYLGLASPDGLAGWTMS